MFYYVQMENAKWRTIFDFSANTRAHGNICDSVEKFS